MQRLLYHAPDNPNQESPFDRAIVQVVQGQNVSIVSPYIGLQYLHRLIGLSAVDSFPKLGHFGTRSR